MEQVLKSYPRLSRADVRYLLGWRPNDPQDASKGSTRHPDQAIAFDLAATKSVLYHLRNLHDSNGTPTASVWTPHGTQNPADRRLGSEELNLLVRSDGTIEDIESALLRLSQLANAAPSGPFGPRDMYAVLEKGKEPRFSEVGPAAQNSFERALKPQR